MLQKIFGDVKQAGKDVLGSPVDAGSSAVSLDPRTQQMIGAQLDRASMSNEALANEQVAGSEAGAQMMQDGGQAQRSAASLGMADNAGLRDALKKRGEKYFGAQQAKLLNKARADAPDQKVKALQAAQGNLAAAEEARFGAAKRAHMAEQNKRAARNQMLSSVLGLGGMAAGAAIGGPSGASAGSQVGSGMAGPTQMQEMG